MKRTFIPQESEIRLNRIRKTRPQFELLPPSLLLNKVLEEYEQQVTKTDPIQDSKAHAAILTWDLSLAEV